MTTNELLLAVIVVLAAICVHLFLENRAMAVDLTALQQSAANITAKLAAVVEQCKTAQANAVDPAALEQIKTGLDTAVTAADAALNPPAAG